METASLALFVERRATSRSTSTLAFEETQQSKIFDNAAFGYWKVTVERPLRLEGADPRRRRFGTRSRT